jgi:hypothetical protein
MATPPSVAKPSVTWRIWWLTPKISWMTTMSGSLLVADTLHDAAGEGESGRATGATDGWCYTGGQG